VKPKGREKLVLRGREVGQGDGQRKRVMVVEVEVG
jgi:hypothetical protein